MPPSSELSCHHLQKVAARLAHNLRKLKERAIKLQLFVNDEKMIVRCLDNGQKLMIYIYETLNKVINK